MILSICCTTYNHEKYLKKALDSILMQKVNFDFEVIIGEDCSTDNSRKILKEYERSNPSFFNIIYHERNVGSSKNFMEVYSKACGKYVIVLETDDYWTDPNKLQTQVDILEESSNIIAVTHLCNVVDENDNINSKLYPSINGGYYTMKDYRQGLFPGQTATMMYRNFHKNTYFNTTLYDSGNGPGDRRKMYMLACFGDIYCIPKVMSYYRYVVEHGDSYSAKHKHDYFKNIEYYKHFWEYAKIAEVSDEALYTAEYLYIKSIISASFFSKERKNTISLFITTLRRAKHKIRCLIEISIYYARKLNKGNKKYIS